MLKMVTSQNLAKKQHNVNTQHVTTIPRPTTKPLTLDKF